MSTQNAVSRVLWTSDQIKGMDVILLQLQKYMNVSNFLSVESTSKNES